MKINTKFSINDKVYVIPLKIDGKVISIYLGETGLQYNCRYFHEYKAIDCFFYESELSLEEPKKDVGFNQK